jgi:tetratricopeptide (TPR) repeat protein
MMSQINWMDKLGWTDEQIEDLRYTGFAYIRQGKYDIALPFFEALTVLNPDGAYDHQTLGALYIELGKPSKALKPLDKALQIEGDHAPTLLNLMKAFFMLGKVEEGLRLANILKNERNIAVSNMAKALLLAYSR